MSNKMNLSSKLYLGLVSASLKSSPYHFREKPAITDVLVEALKEKTISTNIGA